MHGAKTELPIQAGLLPHIVKLIHSKEHHYHSIQLKNLKRNIYYLLLSKYGAIKSLEYNYIVEI